MKPQNYISLSPDEQRDIVRNFWNRFDEIPYTIIENIARKHTLVNDVIYIQPTLVRELVTEIAFDRPEIAEEIFAEAKK